MSLVEATIKAISLFGIDIITEKRFINVLSDFHVFEENPSDKYILSELVKKGMTKKISVLQGATSDQANLIFNECVTQILSELPFREENVASVVANIIEAISSQKINKRIYRKKSISSNHTTSSSPSSASNVEDRILMDVLSHPFGIQELTLDSCSYEQVANAVNLKGWKHQTQITPYGSKALIMNECNLSILGEKVNSAVLLDEEKSLLVNYEINTKEEKGSEFLSKLVDEFCSIGITLKSGWKNSFSYKAEKRSYSIKYHVFSKMALITISTSVKKNNRVLEE